ncbi:MAG: TIR domain-containing protein [Planctomycetota bacterium]
MDFHSRKKARVFLSYAGEDRALAEHFLARLRDDAVEAAASIWYDPDLTPARDYDEEILERLGRADIALVLASPAYRESSYCIERELPVVRERQASGACQARVIRLRESDLGRPFDGLAVWPRGGETVERTFPTSGEWDELRTWFKIEICRALVSRNHDRYGGRTRATELARRRNERSSRRIHDDLTELHDELGVVCLGSPGYALAVLCGGAIAAILGTAMKAVLLPGAPGSVLGWVLFFAALGTAAGVVRTIPALLGGYLAARTSVGARVVPVAAGMTVVAFEAAVHGVLLGLPAGVAVHLGGWQLDPGLLGTAVLSCVLGGYGAWSSLRAFGPKRLKVFADVERVYRPPEPAWITVDPTEPEAAARERAPDRPSPSEPTAASGGEAPRESAGRAVAAEERRGDDDTPAPDATTAEEVRLGLVVLAASDRPADTEAFLSALRAAGTEDALRLDLVTGGKLGPWDLSPCLGERGAVDYFVVLATRDLMESCLPALLAAHLSSIDEYDRPRVYPVLVDRGLGPDAPLLNLQGLPVGRLVIEDWPIRESAWRSVASSLRHQIATDFLAELNGFLRKAVAEERDARERSGVGSGPLALTETERLLASHDRLMRDFDLSSGYVFADPRYDFAHYPFRDRRIYWTKRKALTWTTVGGVCFGLFALVFEPTAASAAVVPLAGFLVALALLGVRDTLDYATMRLDAYWSERIGTIDLLFGVDVERRLAPILRRAARVVAPAAGVAVAAVAAFVASAVPSAPYGKLGFWALGAAIGLGCYVASRYRVPAITVSREAPTPSSSQWSRRGLRVRYRAPREHHADLERSRIDGKRPPQPRVIEGYHMELSLSVGMVLRALLDTAWLFATGFFVFGAAAVGGLPEFLGWALAFYSIAVPLRWMRRHPSRSWSAYKRELFLPALWDMGHYYLFGLLAGVLKALLSVEDDTFLPIALAGILLLTFAKRLDGLLAKASRQHLPEDDLSLPD